MAVDTTKKKKKHKKSEEKQRLEKVFNKMSEKAYGPSSAHSARPRGSTAREVLCYSERGNAY